MMTVQKYSEKYFGQLPQIYAQNHSDPSSDCTSTAAFWSPILDWRQQAAYGEKEGRLWSSNWGWGGRQNGMFCQWSLGHRVHFELNMSCSGGADRDLQTGCRSRKRGGEASDVSCWVRLYALWLSLTGGAKAPVPSLLNRTAPCSPIYF